VGLRLFCVSVLADSLFCLRVSINQPEKSMVISQ